MKKLTDFKLSGAVSSAHTFLVSMSSKSFRLMNNGSRQLLRDYGNPSSANLSSPVLLSFQRFDRDDRLAEDIDVERADDQEPYRCLYTYDNKNRLTKTQEYSEEGALEATVNYIYGINGRKTAEERRTPDGRLQSLSSFDEHENWTGTEWFVSDGNLKNAIRFRYEYSDKGNVLEQLFFPPGRPDCINRLMIEPSGVSELPTTPSPVRYRTVFIRDDDDRLREELRYDVDDRLMEKKMFDEKGTLRQRYWSISVSDNEITVYDELGREQEIRQVGPAGLGSPRELNDVTSFRYDEHGNLAELLTRGPEGLLRTITNTYVYDDQGNWIRRTETETNNIWQTEPFQAAFETMRELSRSIEYFS